MNPRVLSTGYSSALLGLCYMLANRAYENITSYTDTLTGDTPLIGKAFAGTWMSVNALALPAIGYGIATSIVDIAFGTHHYLEMRMWQHFTKDEQRIAELERTIDSQIYPWVRR